MCTNAFYFSDKLTSMAESICKLFSYLRVSVISVGERILEKKLHTYLS